jgi:hypothetical protein
MVKTKTTAQYLHDRLLDVLKKYPECSGLTTIEVNPAPYYATRNWDATIIDANSLAVQMSADCRRAFITEKDRLGSLFDLATDLISS